MRKPYKSLSTNIMVALFKVLDKPKILVRAGPADLLIGILGLRWLGVVVIGGGLRLDSASVAYVSRLQGFRVWSLGLQELQVHAPSNM